MTEWIQCGKYSAKVSTHAPMSPYYHHFVRLDAPVVVGPQHMAVGFVTLSRRSNRTGATTSNEIRYLRIAKMKKDGTPFKVESWVEYNYRDPRLDRDGIQHFAETFALSSQYQHFVNMQVDIGTDLYREYHDYLPDFWINEIAIQTYLKLKRDGQLRREEALLEARCRVLEARAQFLGNDPIIGLPELQPKPQVVNEQMLIDQRNKVNKLQRNILESPRLAIDFTDHLELRDEKIKLAKMERGVSF